MAAFERAVGLGYRYLETDVRATADGALVAFHDATLDRVTDRTGQVARLTFAEVAKARIAGREPIPRLEEILTAWPEARLNIDVKAENAIGPLTEVLHQARAWDRVCVTSFSYRRLRQVRARMRLLSGRDVCTARLVRLAELGVPCAQVPQRVGRTPLVTEAFLGTAHSLGLQVHVWTVNEPADMKRLLDLGVDGIITDDIEALRDVMTARALWAAATA
jgi:glycerophosphoryl diester phosphodiesterase